MISVTRCISANQTRCQVNIKHNWSEYCVALVLVGVTIVSVDLNVAYICPQYPIILVHTQLILVIPTLAEDTRLHGAQQINIGACHPVICLVDSYLLLPPSNTAPGSTCERVPFCSFG